MTLLYFFGIQIYGLIILISSLFNDKAKQWVNGRRNIFSKLKQTLSVQDEQRIWIHCSSYGEFEQGKPLMEAMRKEFPEKKIVLTFFSPSGYEHMKNDKVADYVFYLPLDSPANARKFIEIVNPMAAFFVKYEFWHFYIKHLKDKNIPCYSVSSTFRPSQIYFRWYGGFFKRILQRLSMIFVQNQNSLTILYNQSLSHVTVSGDTRFDRVYQNSLNAKSFPEIEKFISKRPVFVGGSTWPDDEKLIAQLANDNRDFCFIIVPHELREANLNSLASESGISAIRYSNLRNAKGNEQVLILDTVGMLSSLYKYADLAYIGGGFNQGIHNILEAVVFGCPVIFGPKYQKFNEAVDLLKAGGAYSIKSYKELKQVFSQLKNNPEIMENVRSINKRFIENRKGATSVIINYLHLNW